MVIENPEFDLIAWLLEGDVSIQYQVKRDLIGIDDPVLRNRISSQGFGARFLAERKPTGHWGQSFYQPKWISSHYSLLDIKHLGMHPDQAHVRESIYRILKENRGVDNGINPARSIPDSDICVNGMFLNYACYFLIEEEKLTSVIDFMLDQQMPDGGFNCNKNRFGAVHSSLHSTISVLEGFWEYENNGYAYRLDEIQRVCNQAQEFILLHKLYKSDHTGEIIDKRFLMLSYPSRYRYDILRALDYFRAAGVGFDSRMQDAVEVLMKKRRRNGAWPVQTKHPGQTHFDMEKTGADSRWNTLRSLRVLKHFKLLS